MEKESVTFTREKKDSGENRKITNILNLLYMLLIQDNQNAEYYAVQLDCQLPTVKKYIRAIRASYDAAEGRGFNVDYNSQEKRYELSSYIKFPAFSPEEIEALHIAVRYLSVQEGTPFTHLEEIEKNLKKYVTKETREKLVKKIEYSGPRTESKLNELLSIIDEGINQKRKVVMEYHKTFHKETSISNVFPYSIHNHEYEWYLRAFCFKDKILKTYSINQIVSMKCEKLTAKEEKMLPKNPDIKPVHRWDWDNKELSGELIDVKIKFTGYESEKMKKKTSFIKEHPSQEVEINGEDVIVSFKVRNPYNMLPWIFKFRGEAEVLEPEILREKIRNDLLKLMEIYKKA